MKPLSTLAGGSEAVWLSSLIPKGAVPSCTYARVRTHLGACQPIFPDYFTVDRELFNIPLDRNRRSLPHRLPQSEEALVNGVDLISHHTALAEGNWPFGCASLNAFFLLLGIRVRVS